MTREGMEIVMEKVFDELREVRKAGQAEYAHDEDNAFANFERVGERLGIDRKKVLLVYKEKHADGVAAYVLGHISQREDVRGRIKDQIMYLILLRGMVEEEEGTDIWVKEAIARKHLGPPSYQRMTAGQLNERLEDDAHK